MTNEQVRRAVRRAGAQARSELLTQFHMDLAASIQAVTEEVVLRLTRALAQRDRRRATCASPAAWRSIASPTARCCATAHFDDIWIQPAAGDAGGAVGAALAAYHLHLRPAAQRRNGADGMAGAYLGPSLRAGRDRAAADSGRRALHACSTTTTLIDTTARRARRRQGGRLVPGPHGVRAARARRPLDPRRSALARRCRRCSTSRSSTARASGPSRPSVLREDVADWFELDCDSPYMLLVADVGRRRRRADDRGGAGAVRHRQAQRAALGHSGRHPRRLFGAHPDRAPRDQSALPRADRALQGS